MALGYAPQTIGKGATSGNFRFIKADPRFFGFSGGTGAIAKGIAVGARFVASNYKFFTGIGAIGIGAGVSYDGGIRVDAPQSEYQQAHSASGYRFNNGRNYQKYHNRKLCRCTKRKRRRSNSRRRY